MSAPLLNPKAAGACALVGGILSALATGLYYAPGLGLPAPVAPLVALAGVVLAGVGGVSQQMPAWARSSSVLPKAGLPLAFMAAGLASHVHEVLPPEAAAWGGLLATVLAWLGGAATPAPSHPEKPST